MEQCELIVPYQIKNLACLIHQLLHIKIFCANQANVCHMENLFLTCNFNNQAPSDISLQYVDGLAPKGVLSQDIFSLSIHDAPNITFVCAYQSVQQIRTLRNGWTYRIMDLSPSLRSFFGQILALQLDNNIMSYCFTNQAYNGNTTSWISFGGQISKDMSFTTLFASMEHFYVNFNNKII